MAKCLPGSLRSRLRTASKLTLRTVPEAWTLARHVRQEQASLLHLNNNTESQEAGVLAAKIAGVACVAHARSFQRPTPFLRRIARRVDCHVAISQEVAKNLLTIGAPPEKIVMIHDGINVNRFADVPHPLECRRELNIPIDAPAFAIFGRLIPWKGIKEFVLASAQVFEELPEARGFIVGGVSDGDESYVSEVHEIVASLGLTDKVRFTGYQGDIRRFMASMDLVVHASTSPEPFGMVLIEAMALSKPVIATRGGGPDEIVVPGETGRLVERRSVPELAHAILEILRHPETGTRMGLAGRRRVEDHFTSRIYAQKVMALYEKLLAARRRPPRGRGRT